MMKMKEQEAVRMNIRLPADARKYVEERATHNFTSANAEVVRCIRQAMKMEKADAEPASA